MIKLYDHWGLELDKWWMNFNKYNIVQFIEQNLKFWDKYSVPLPELTSCFKCISNFCKKCTVTASLTSARWHLRALLENVLKFTFNILTGGYDAQQNRGLAEEEDSVYPALLEREFHSLHRNVPGLRRAGVDTNAIRQVSYLYNNNFKLGRESATYCFMPNKNYYL